MTDAPSSPRPAIAVAATFTADPVASALNFMLPEAGLDLDVKLAPYNQLFQQLLSRTSTLSSNSQGVNVILVRIEDFVRDLADVASARALVARTTRELCDGFVQYEMHAQSPSVIGIFMPSPAAAPELKTDFEEAAATIAACLRERRGMHVLDLKHIEQTLSGEKYDPLRDELAHIPFTESFFAAIALAVARKTHALRKPAHKVLVLDCDNTLWRGVVGEDGVDGVVICPPFLDLQRFAVSEQSTGTLVCLVSKNVEQDVLEVFSRRPEMVLKTEHIVAHRINWKPKPENIASLSRELNLGLDSFVFIDDNPIECAEVRAALPEVVTLNLPPEAQIPQFLQNLWVFDKVSVTVEDTQRTKMYRQNAARQTLESSTTDIGDFIASLGLVIDIAPPSESEWPRVAQLTQRTNQFNFTTLRRSEVEMRACATSSAEVLRVNVGDRFGAYGLVGVIVADTRDNKLVVDTLLLSCRVLGRGVEHAMLRRLGEFATERGLASVDLPFIATAKNEPAQAFAESVAREFKSGDGGSVLYSIPVEVARSITHRPGHDPEAVIKASKAGESKQPAAVDPRQGSPTVNRSERYTRLSCEYVSGRAIVDAVRMRSLHSRELAERLVEPSTAAEHKLIALWQELLNVDKLGVEDDYFALGGTSLLAANMFAEIAQRFGKKLPLTTILEFPTIRSLARQIEAGAQSAISSGPRAIDRSGVLVELKPGGNRNLFLIHDGDGETLLYLNLARRLPDNVTVFGVEPRRLSRVPLAHTRIEDMARFYIDAVRKKQPRGPYMLGGLCAGGVIAYEMASQLQVIGESVELVALFDAAKPRARKRIGQISKQRVRRLEAVFAGVRGEEGILLPRLYSSIKEASLKLKNFLAWELSSRARRLTTRMRFRLLHELLERGRPWPSALPELSVREIYDSAESRYLPKTLSNAGILLLRAQSGDEYDQPYREVYADETFDWSSVAKDITVIDVKGGHSSMLQEPFVESLVNAITNKVLLQQPPEHDNATRSSVSN